MGCGCGGNNVQAQTATQQEDQYLKKAEIEQQENVDEINKRLLAEQKQRLISRMQKIQRTNSVYNTNTRIFM